MAIDPAWLALIGTAVGTVGVSVVNHLLNSKRDKTDYAMRMREELRAEIALRKEEIESLEKEVEDWRAKYYDLRDELIKMQTELTITIHNLKSLSSEGEV